MTLKKTITLALLTISLSGMAQTDNIIRIGHRGAMGHLAENTLPSIKKAVEMRCDMIEIDVYKIKSGEVMVFHDTTLERITNGKGAIEDYTFEELRKIKVAGEYQIPTLQEVIETIDRNAVLNIELKGKNTALASYKIVQDYLSKGWKSEDFIVSSFHWNELENISQQESSIPLAVLIAQDPISEAISFALKIHAVAINPYYKLLTPDTVLTIKKAGLKTYPWTVNNPSDILILKELKVDGIISNFPERV